MNRAPNQPLLCDPQQGPLFYFLSLWERGQLKRCRKVRDLRVTVSRPAYGIGTDGY